MSRSDNEFVAKLSELRRTLLKSGVSIQGTEQLVRLLRKAPREELPSGLLSAAELQLVGRFLYEIRRLLQHEPGSGDVAGC